MNDSRRQLVRAIFVALVVCAALGMATTDARASCGDYLLGGHEGLMLHGDAAVPHTAAAEQSDSAKWPRRGPCRGPGCRQAPSPLGPPSAPLSTQLDQERCVWLDGDEVVPSNTRSDCIAAEAPHPSPGAPLRIDRPPRLG